MKVTGMDTKAAAGRAVDAVFDTITKELSRGEEISIPQFGKFKVAKRKAREARNPKTGETVHVPAKTVAKFTPAKALKETVN